MARGDFFCGFTGFSLNHQSSHAERLNRGQPALFHYKLTGMLVLNMTAVNRGNIGENDSRGLVVEQLF